MHKMIMHSTNYLAVGGGIFKSIKLRDNSPSYSPPNYSVKIGIRVHKAEFLHKLLYSSLRPKLLIDKYSF